MDPKKYKDYLDNTIAISVTLSTLYAKLIESFFITSEAKYKSKLVLVLMQLHFMANCYLPQIARNAPSLKLLYFIEGLSFRKQK
jgi:hypothetical protein